MINVKVKGLWAEPDPQQQIDLIKIAWFKNDAQVLFFEWPRTQTDQTVTILCEPGDEIRFDIRAWSASYGNGPISSSAILHIAEVSEPVDPNAPGPIHIISIERVN